MAALGQVRDSFWAECGPARMAFAERFRELIGVMSSKKQGARAGQLEIPISSLSNYWSGRRVPRLPILRKIYGDVRTHSAHVVMPVTLAELEVLHERAMKGERDRMAASAIADAAPAVPAQCQPVEQAGRGPAAGPAQHRRNEPSEKMREALGILRAARASGDLRHVIGTAWSASRTLSEAELCDAVATLHATGDADLVEVLLLADGQRSADDTMRLALTLMRAGLSSSAELVMQTSLSRAGRAKG